MKASDFRLRMDFQALLATHLRMIHELGAVNQQATLGRKREWNQSSEGAKS